MQTTRFTIIIPTLNRSETLFYTLQTCVHQDYDNLMILVSDNASDDNTVEIVTSFNDPRIHYINPGKRLSMSHHWEFALSHVKEGFVSILGDDDGFLPGAISKFAFIAESTDVQAICTNQGLYYWSGLLDPRVNRLYFNLRKGHTVLNTKTNLKDVLTGHKYYDCLPNLYNSFIHINAITAVKQQSGSFFKSKIPDVYSGIAIAAVIDKYAYSYENLKVMGASPKSNGMALMYTTGDKEVAKRFLQEDALPIHPLASSTLGRVIGIIVGECFLQSFDAGLNHSLKKDFNWQVFINASRQEALNSDNSIYRDEIEKSIAEIIAKNKLQVLSQYKPEKSILHALSYIKNLTLIINASQFGVSDIHGACLLHKKLLDNPNKYLVALLDTARGLKDTRGFRTIIHSLFKYNKKSVK